MKTATLWKHLSIVSVAAIALSLGNVHPAHAMTLTAPNSVTAVEGNDGRAFPFDLPLQGVSSQRYQQVFAASEFSSFTVPHLITQIRFRPDVLPNVASPPLNSAGRAFSATLPNIQINLSTTSKAPDGLSTTFAANVGANDTVVYSGALTLASAFTGPGSGPKDFDIIINLTQAFLYDRSQGNLLLDIRNFSGVSLSSAGQVLFDATNVPGDSVSRVFANDVNLTAGAADTRGLVTQFTATPIPTPALLPGIAVWTLGMLRQRRAERNPSVKL